MQKMLYLGGVQTSTGLTHPITVFHPNRDDKTDDRSHALMAREDGEKLLAARPSEFAWAQADAPQQALSDQQALSKVPGANLHSNDAPATEPAKRGRKPAKG